ncbi:hypothetical protein FQR65_LT13896 [Abscondita terminalis]|nr:hypothetical protein FQR65_LT13896 [Abscondita terminalis]
MKYFILACFLAVVAAAPKPQVAPYNPYGGYVNPGAYNPYYRNPTYYPQPYAHYAAPAISDTREARPDGSYRYSYATADGQQVQAEGVLKSLGPGVEVPVVTGSYSYTAPDGTPVSVTYVADEFGFRAHGPQIPNAEAIDRAVAFNIQNEKYQGRIPVGPFHK